MAKLTSKGIISGIAGPIVFRNIGGQQVLQSKPARGKIKQTKGTKTSASDFGTASSLAKAIRGALFPILQNHSDPAFYRRFTAQVHNATQSGNGQPKGNRLLTGGDISMLNHTDCNANSPFSEYCSLSPAAMFSETNSLQLTIPDFVVSDTFAKFPGASHGELALLVVALDVSTLQVSNEEMFRVGFSLDDATIPSQQWTTAPLPEGKIIVVTTAVFYSRQNNLAGTIMLNSKDRHPCEITMVLQS